MLINEQTPCLQQVYSFYIILRRDDFQSTLNFFLNIFDLHQSFIYVDDLNLSILIAKEQICKKAAKAQTFDIFQIDNIETSKKHFLISLDLNQAKSSSTTTTKM